MSNRIFDRTLDTLAKALELRAERQSVLTSNIANADTPGYKAKRVDFEDALARAINLDDAPMDRTDARHMTAGGEVGEVKADVYDNPNNIIRSDGNSVDRDAEMVASTQNQLMHDAAVEMIRRKLALMKYSINEGGH